MKEKTNELHIKRLGIDTYQDAIVYMRESCSVCRSEGFEAQTRVTISADGKSIVATVNVVLDHILEDHEVGLSETAFKRLALPEGAHDGHHRCRRGGHRTVVHRPAVRPGRVAPQGP